MRAKTEARNLRTSSDSAAMPFQQVVQEEIQTSRIQATISLCHDYHNAIHRLVPSHKELGRNYNTRDKLLSHAQIHSFVAWMRKRK